MPAMIKHIDQIAREKGRDVVFASFEDDSSTKNEARLRYTAPNHFNDNWSEDFNRAMMIAWLKEAGIQYEEVSHYASENGWQAYAGNIYIDVPFDDNDPQYRQLIEQWETPEGKPKHPQVKLWVLTHEQAMKNAHHDEPGFWEKWAETF